MEFVLAEVLAAVIITIGLALNGIILYAVIDVLVHIFKERKNRPK